MVTLVTRTDAPKVSGPPQGQWTYADWEALPDSSNRYEVIDGVLYMSTSPSLFHQWIIKRLVTRLGVKAEELDLAHVFFAPTGVIMPGSEPVQPDFIIVLKGREAIIHDRRIWGVPDVIAEVLSPGNQDYDTDVKKAAYERAGVSEYLIFDPGTRTVRHYSIDAAGHYPEARVYTATDTLILICLLMLPVQVNEFFDGSPDTSL